MGNWIELVQNVDDAALVVREVIHLRDEDAIVRTASHEANALQTLRGDADAEAIGKCQIKRLSVGEHDVMSGGGCNIRQGCDNKQDQNGAFHAGEINTDLKALA